MRLVGVKIESEKNYATVSEAGEDQNKRSRLQQKTSTTGTLSRCCQNCLKDYAHPYINCYLI